MTGKPLDFFTYDLDRYRDELRGFYSDQSAAPPGPLSTTTEELVADLGDLPRLVSEFAEPYRRFRETYCPHDDGHATQRFIERFFGATSPPR